MREMHQCAIGGLLKKLSEIAKFQRRAINVSLKMEGGQFYSKTARWILEKRFGVSIGHYSYGDCFLPESFPAGIIVGRYVSIGPGVRVFLRNHPLDRLSMHPFFYNERLGFVPNDNIESKALEIGHDAWIGAQAILLPGCSRIGIGAVIGAGSVVTKNIPDFAIAVGNPARVVRMRFSDEICEKVLLSQWWERTAEECVKHMPHMIVPLTKNSIHHPLLQPLS